MGSHDNILTVIIINQLSEFLSVNEPFLIHNNCLINILRRNILKNSTNADNWEVCSVYNVMLSWFCFLNSLRSVVTLSRNNCLLCKPSFAATVSLFRIFPSLLLFVLLFVHRRLKILKADFHSPHKYSRAGEPCVVFQMTAVSKKKVSKKVSTWVQDEKFKPRARSFTISLTQLLYTIYSNSKKYYPQSFTAKISICRSTYLLNTLLYTCQWTVDLFLLCFK